MREARHVVRFGRLERIQHLLLFVSFLTLAATGLPLLFSDAAWARPLAAAFGGFAVTSVVHRVFAVLLLAVFAVHVARVVLRLARGEFGILWGPDSMVPQPRDASDMVAHIRWFLRRGPKPKFDRFTYWEKFDYWAVFWGMVVIGGSGLLLWFPEWFATVLPGWVFNVALLVHGEEALLAIAFITTIHFFNSHMRPKKFPMDMVMFTGVVEMDEYRHERPLEVRRLAEAGRLDARLTGAPDPRFVRRARALGAVAIAVGLSLFVMIVFAVLTR